MATVINTDTRQDATTSVIGFILALIIILLLLGFVLYYGPGLIRGVFVGSQPQVNIPSKIDVNINKSP